MVRIHKNEDVQRGTCSPEINGFVPQNQNNDYQCSLSSKIVLVPLFPKTLWEGIKYKYWCYICNYGNWLNMVECVWEACKTKVFFLFTLQKISKWFIKEWRRVKLQALAGHILTIYCIVCLKKQTNKQKKNFSTWWFVPYNHNELFIFEPRHEKTCLQGLRSGKTQTRLLSYRD